MLPEASRSLLRNFFRLRSMPASSVFTDMYVLRSSPSFCCNTAMRCEASSSGSVTGNISTSTQHLSFKNPNSTRASKTKSKKWVIRLYLCPQVIYMSLPNLHYFVTIFNLLVIITISFCSYTNFGNGSFVFVWGLSLGLCLLLSLYLPVPLPFHSPGQF